MADYTVAIDAGNGSTNAVRDKGRGYSSVSFPSVRAAATGDTLGLGSLFELQYDYVDWGDNRYLVGDDVFISRRAVERHQGAFRYGDEFHLFLLAVALGKLLPKGGSVDLTLFAPPGLYFNAKQSIEKRMKAIQRRIAIRFKGDKQPRVYKIERLTIHPEGLGALACFLLDAQGRAVAEDLLAGENVILDAGMYTLDALQISDGQFNPESLQSATWENGGLRQHVLEPVLRVVKKQGTDFQLLTINDVDLALRQGLETGDYSLVSGASRMNIQPAVNRFAERYAQWIANSIIDGIFNGLRGIKSVVLVGGGAALAQPHLASWYGEKLLSQSEHKHVRKVSPIELNAVGGLRLALAQRADAAQE